MLILFVIFAVWLAILTVVLGACRIAAQSDRTDMIEAHPDAQPVQPSQRPAPGAQPIAATRAQVGARRAPTSPVGTPSARAA